MPNFDVAKAVRSNPIYGRHVGWIRQLGRVIAGLGGNPNSAVAFAECVAAWQSKHHLKPDGMLGPKTWAKLRLLVPSGAPVMPVPDWLRLPPEAEGWIDAIVATLENDTSFLSLRHGVHAVQYEDFKEIARFIADGVIEVVPTDFRGGSYEFRNTEEDADSLKTPRRYGGSWRGMQALLIHEAVHAISDLRRYDVSTIDEEAFAYVVQGMFLEKYRASLVRRDAATERLRREARALGARYLARNTVSDADWEPLRDAIRRHPVYASRVRNRLVFDGLYREP